MTDNNGVHSGSLQFYPRVRAKKVIPSVNWKPLEKDGVGFMGFVGYKAGMVSVWARDDSENSLTKGKRIAVPATLIECPTMKIYLVRFYKDGRVLRDVVVSNDKILKRSVKVGKNVGKIEDGVFSGGDSDGTEFDDVRVVMYSNIGKTGIGKKKVNLIEIGISGDKDAKLSFIKDNLNKDISVVDVFSDGLVDVRGVSKGFGTGGPVKRFGISLKANKSEKGQRRPGSLAPWHPARVTFRAPQTGQTGYHNRVSYNSLILETGKLSNRDINREGGYNRYGVIKNDYMILRGSIPGPVKRGIVITPALRPTKLISKKKLEVLELR